MYEEEEASGVEEIRLRARRGTLGDHELAMATKYCGNGLWRRTNGGDLSRHIRSSYAPNPEATVKILQGGITIAPKGILLCAGCYEACVIDADT